MVFSNNNHHYGVFLYQCCAICMCSKVENLRECVVCELWGYNHVADFVCCPAITRSWPYAGLTLGRRRRRWHSFKPAKGQRLVFVGAWGLIVIVRRASYSNTLRKFSSFAIGGNGNASVQTQTINFYVFILLTDRGEKQHRWKCLQFLFTCHLHVSTLFWKAKRQYLLTCKVSRYCLLALHGSTGGTPMSYSPQYKITISRVCTL